MAARISAGLSLGPSRGWLQVRLLHLTLDPLDHLFDGLVGVVTGSGFGSGPPAPERGRGRGRERGRHVLGNCLKDLVGRVPGPYAFLRRTSRLSGLIMPIFSQPKVEIRLRVRSTSSGEYEMKMKSVHLPSVG